MLTLPSARQLKVVSERLRHVEDLLAEAQSQDHAPVEAEVVVASIEEQDYVADGSERRSGLPKDVLAQPVPHETLMVIELFFEHYERFYPCFEKMKFINSIVQPSARGPTDAEPLRVAVHSMLCIAFRMARHSSSNDDRQLIEQQAEAHLKAALHHVHAVLAAEPTLLSIQALLLTSISMSLSSATVSKAPNMILAAVHRGAQLLGYTASSSPHSAAARTCWTAYILDQSMSSSLDVLPLAHDTSVDIAELDILPQHRGTLAARDGSITIDVFIARIKLARIQCQIWTTLLAPAARTASRETRLTAHDDIRAMLIIWRDLYMPPVETLRQELWPSAAYVHVVRLVLEYFLSLRRMLPASFSDVDELRDHLQLLPDSSTDAVKVIRENVLLPAELVRGSQHAFAAIRSVGNAGLPWLKETLPAIVAAMVVSYQAAIVELDLAAHQHFDCAEPWYEMLDEISGEVMQDGNTMPVLGTLRQLASVALDR